MVINFEKKPFESLPEENTLPLKVTESQKHTEHGDSTVWETVVQDKGGHERNIALKQIKKEKFATPEEMQVDKRFYESLKNSPLGKFIPSTLHFIAQVTPDQPPQGFRTQQFIEGKPIDMISDSELYKDPAVARQLLELTEAALELLQTARKEKTHQPDFRRAPKGFDVRATIGGLISDPRYSKNIVVADGPDENGQRVFFVDTGINATERTVKSEELLARHVVNPLEQMHLKRWKKKLEDILKE